MNVWGKNKLWLGHTITLLCGDYFCVNSSLNTKYFYNFSVCTWSKTIKREQNFNQNVKINIQNTDPPTLDTITT